MLTLKVVFCRKLTVSITLIYTDTDQIYSDDTDINVLGLTLTRL